MPVTYWYMRNQPRSQKGCLRKLACLIKFLELVHSIGMLNVWYFFAQHKGEIDTTHDISYFDIDEMWLIVLGIVAPQSKSIYQEPV